MTDTVLRFPRVRERVGGLSKSWIYQEITEGRFPMPIKLGGRAVGWLESEINAWLLSRVEQSRPTKDTEVTSPDVRGNANTPSEPATEPSLIGRFAGPGLRLRPGFSAGRSQH